MPHDKRVCRRENRISHGPNQNYTSPKMYKYAKRKKLIAKLSRKRNRK